MTRRRGLAVMAAVLVLVVGGVVAVRHRSTSPAALRLPVLGPARDAYDGDLGDPFVLPVSAGGTVQRYVAFGTGSWPGRVPTASTPDLQRWEDGPDALPSLPSWSPPDPQNAFSWAPAALQTADGFLLYVTLPEARSGQQCIGLAASATAEGPYAGVGDGPLVCQHDLGGSIDPAVVRDRAGALHLLWKNDGNSVGAASSLWSQDLTADGRAVVGAPHRLLTAGLPWQGGIVEEPAVIPAADGGWWLFYSGSFFDQPGYATGLAHCPTLDGPCTDSLTAPFLTTDTLAQANQFAPGGLETFRDGAGTLWAVFDTWNRPTRDGHFYCCRSLQLAKVLSA